MGRELHTLAWLRGELRELAAAEFRRVFGEPAAQAIRMAAMSE